MRALDIISSPYQHFPPDPCVKADSWRCKFTMSKGNAFSFWQKKEEVTARAKQQLIRSSSTASEFLHLRKSKGKRSSSPLAAKKEENVDQQPTLRIKPNANFAGPAKQEETMSDVGGEDDGSPVLKRPTKNLPPPPIAEEEEELRKFVRKSIRRIKRETKILSQDFTSTQNSTIPELDPVEVDEEEVEEMLPLVKEILAGNELVSEEEDEVEADPEKVPIIISVEHVDEDPADSRDGQSTEYEKPKDVEVAKQDCVISRKEPEQNFEALMKELENSDNLDPESTKDILKRSLSALKTMSERIKTLESEKKGPPSSSAPLAPSGPPPPPPPAPPPSLLAGPKPLVITKRERSPQADKIAGPPQVCFS